MKRIFLLLLAAMPLFAFTVNFVYNDYDDYENGYYDEYWTGEYWSDGDWIYYPHGYYCVHYVWWHPWWWSWYWDNCHWCHHFSWDFFYSGFYVVWYDAGGWWYRPRYGYMVRYQLPYTYGEIRYHAGQNGIYLPASPSQQISIPYNEKRIMALSKQNDPELFARIEKEHKSGNLEKMQNEYQTNVKKLITQKNEKYQTQNNNHTKPSNTARANPSRPQEQNNSNKKHSTTLNSQKNSNNNERHIVSDEKSESHNDKNGNANQKLMNNSPQNEKSHIDDQAEKSSRKAPMDNTNHEKSVNSKKYSTARNR